MNRIGYKQLEAKMEQVLEWLNTYKPAPEGYKWAESWNGHICHQAINGGGQSIKIYVHGNTTRERYYCLVSLLDLIYIL